MSDILETLFADDKTATIEEVQQKSGSELAWTIFSTLCAMAATGNTWKSQERSVPLKPLNMATT
ncbi:MAG: hypothetical protein ACI9XK_005203, partial [Granulosicoccus sp.]